MSNNEKIVELIGIFEKAKEKFLKEEKEIIEINVNERTLSARLMFHLQTLLLEDETRVEIVSLSASLSKSTVRDKIPSQSSL